MELLPNESPHPRHSHRLVQHTGKRAEGCNDHSLYLQLNRGWPRGVNLSAMLLSVTIECCMRSTDARASSTVRSGRRIRSRCRYESRSAFQREAAVGIDRPVSEANQSGTKGRGEGNCFKQWRGPFLAHRAPGSTPRVFAHRHLARSGSGPGKSRHYRCLSDGGLAEGTARYGAVRLNCSVRVDSQHQGAGGRSRSLHGGRQSHRHSGPSRSLIAFGDKRMDFNTANIHVPPV